MTNLKIEKFSRGLQNVKSSVLKRRLRKLNVEHHDVLCADVVDFEAIKLIKLNIEAIKSVLKSRGHENLERHV